MSGCPYVTVNKEVLLLHLEIISLTLMCLSSVSRSSFDFGRPDAEPGGFWDAFAAHYH